MLVLGSGRSGTTWIAEVLARLNGYRLIFEPFHPFQVNKEGYARLCLSAEERGHAAHIRMVREVLSGGVRGAWVDQLPTAQCAAGRVIKDIHTTNLAPWLRAHYPQTPLVYVLRHPVATSVSRLRAGAHWGGGLGDFVASPAGRREAEESPMSAWLPIYDRYCADRDPLVSLVAEWCLENAYPIEHLTDNAIEVVRFEDITIDPKTELVRLAKWGSESPGSVGTDVDMRQPSYTDWLGNAAAALRSNDRSGLVCGWERVVTRRQVDRCLGVLSDFGLDQIYGRQPMPPGPSAS